MAATGGTRATSASFGPAAVKELETLRTKYSVAQDQITAMQSELDKLKGANGDAGEAVANGTSSSTIDSEALERLQAEKEKTQADLEAAMAELEEKAKTVAELQESVGFAVVRTENILLVLTARRLLLSPPRRNNCRLGLKL
jgi:predicted  nucleic acid-binding Zn-ribbon protein